MLLRHALLELIKKDGDREDVGASLAELRLCAHPAPAVEVNSALEALVDEGYSMSPFDGYFPSV